MVGSMPQDMQISLTAVQFGFHGILLTFCKGQNVGQHEMLFQPKNNKGPSCHIGVLPGNAVGPLLPVEDGTLRGAGRQFPNSALDVTMNTKTEEKTGIKMSQMPT